MGAAERERAKEMGGSERVAAVAGGQQAEVGGSERLVMPVAVMGAVAAALMVAVTGKGGVAAAAVVATISHPVTVEEAAEAAMAQEAEVKGRRGGGGDRGHCWDRHTVNRLISALELVVTVDTYLMNGRCHLSLAPNGDCY